MRKDLQVAYAPEQLDIKKFARMPMIADGLFCGIPP